MYNRSLINMLINILTNQTTDVSVFEGDVKSNSRQLGSYESVDSVEELFSVFKQHNSIERMKQLIPPSGGKKRNKTRKRHKKK